MRLRLALLATATLGLPVLASAQPVSGLYVGAGAGGNILQDETVRASNAPVQPSFYGKGTNYKFDAGGIGVGSVGYGLGNGLRFEGQISGYDNKIRAVENGGLTNPTSAGGDEYKVGAFANVLYDVPLQSFGINSPVYPYVGGGIGYVYTRVNNLHISNLTATGTRVYQRSNASNNDLGYQAIAGLSYPIAPVPGLSLTLEYRFMGEAFDRLLKFQDFSNAGVRAGRQSIVDNFNHSLLLGVRYAFGVAGPAPLPGVATPIPPQTGSRTYLVFFDWDRADLTDRARQIVADAAQASTRVQYTRIQVQGNADRSGTPAYNQRLSLRRAQTVAAELVRDGVPRTAIDIQAFGDTRPLVPTAAGVREPQNRRVAIILQ